MVNPTHVIEFPDGTLKPGDVVRIQNLDGNTLLGWYKYEHAFPNGDLAFFGPVNESGTTSNYARFRAFKRSQVKLAQPKPIGETKPKAKRGRPPKGAAT